MIQLAHRGYSAKYPENTMIAFISAIEHGFDGIETDVHLTKDNYLVLCHDETIDRTSNGSGFIKDMTLKELRQYNYSNNMDVACDIPLLSDLLDYIKDKNVYLNLEIKTDQIHYQDIEEKVLKMVSDYHLEENVYYSSFYLESLLKIQSLNPNAYVGYLFNKEPKKKISLALKHHLSGVHPRYNLLTDEMIEKLHQKHLFITTWTVPDHHYFQHFNQLNVDVCISNDYLGGKHEIR